MAKKTTTQVDHTPTPWVINDPDGDVLPIVAPIASTGYDESIEVCSVSFQDGEAKEANADFIVHACNNFEALLEAARSTANYYQKRLTDGKSLTKMEVLLMHKLRGAISKAEIQKIK